MVYPAPKTKSIKPKAIQIGNLLLAGTKYEDWSDMINCSLVILYEIRRYQKEYSQALTLEHRQEDQDQ